MSSLIIENDQCLVGRSLTSSHLSTNLFNEFHVPTTSAMDERYTKLVSALKNLRSQNFSVTMRESKHAIASTSCAFFFADL